MVLIPGNQMARMGGLEVQEGRGIPLTQGVTHERVASVSLPCRLLLQLLSLLIHPCIPLPTHDGPAFEIHGTQLWSTRSLEFLSLAFNMLSRLPIAFPRQMTHIHMFMCTCAYTCRDIGTCVYVHTHACVHMHSCTDP